MLSIGVDTGKRDRDPRRDSTSVHVAVKLEGFVGLSGYRLTSSGAHPHLNPNFRIFNQIFQHLHLHQYELDRRCLGLY